MPIVLTTHRSLPARDFRVAAGLYHVLFARSPVETVVATDSPLLPDDSREARAFAAELTAPVARLRAMKAGRGVWSRHDLNAAARELGVSPLVVKHQVENRGLGGVVDTF